MWAEISPAMITKSVVVNFLVGSGSSVQNPLQIRVRAGVPGDSDSIDLTTSPPCEVTGRRHRVSPCRSSYSATVVLGDYSLLTSEDVGKNQLYCITTLGKYSCFSTTSPEV